MATILPTGEELYLAPDEILRYLNPDGLRQVMEQEKRHWMLKPNKDCDYYDDETLFRYTSELRNDGLMERMEIRTYPDNGAYPGYAWSMTDSGLFGIPHNLEKWSQAMSEESNNRVINRAAFGAMATVPEKKGYGLNDDNEEVPNTSNRIAAVLCDPYDGRAYLFSNDDPAYVNNETRSAEEKIPARAIARIGDIPTRMTQLMNDLDFVADPDYRHTDNSFTNSNRFILDNIDDRTFVYPEISKDERGQYIDNRMIGLNGPIRSYGESDGHVTQNSQPDLGINPDLGDYGDRYGEALSSYGRNQDPNRRGSATPGIFRSYEELARVDLVDQLMTPNTDYITPGNRRDSNYYKFDGKWGSNWFDREGINESYLSKSQNPNNMENNKVDQEPTPYAALNQTGDQIFHKGKLYQWRYNRVTLKYYSKDISIDIVESGIGYKVGDVLRWTFGDDVFLYKVLAVGANGQIMRGEYRPERQRIFEQDPSTNGVGLPFANTTGVGHSALLAVRCPATIETFASQIKNNLYAYVDVTPTVRSNTTSPWSDVSLPSDQNGHVVTRSTAAGPAYSGINSGRGGPKSNLNSNNATFYEHGGNATAGMHVHLFRYVIDTEHPRYVERDGIKVYLGKWVDQGPLGVERPCDIKALLFSNPDTNNFNNYYKFMLDALLDSMDRSPDATVTNSKNSTSSAWIHKDSCDPLPDQRFFDYRVDPDTSAVQEIDITDRVLYINEATGVVFTFNATHKNDPTFGYGMQSPGWIPIAGATTR